MPPSALRHPTPVPVAPAVAAAAPGTWRIEVARRAGRVRRGGGPPALPDAVVGGLDAASLQLGRPLGVVGVGDELTTLAWPEIGEDDEDAVAAGRCGLVVEALGEPRGVAVWWRSPAGDVVLPGGRGTAGRGTTLHVEAPDGTTVARLVDGVQAGPPDVVGRGEWPAWFPGLHRVELLREDRRGELRRWVLPSPVLLD